MSIRLALTHESVPWNRCNSTALSRSIALAQYGHGQCSNGCLRNSSWRELAVHTLASTARVEHASINAQTSNHPRRSYAMPSQYEIIALPSPSSRFLPPAKPAGPQARKPARRSHSHPRTAALETKSAPLSRGSARPPLRNRREMTGRRLGPRGPMSVVSVADTGLGGPTTRMWLRHCGEDDAEASTPFGASWQAKQRVAAKKSKKKDGERP